MNQKLAGTGFLFILILCISLNCSRIIPENVTQIIDDVQQEFAHEKRTSVFDVNAVFANDSLVLSGELLSGKARQALVDRIGALEKFEIKDQLTLLPHPDVGDESYGLIKLSTAQVRRSPEIESEMITQGIMGTRIRVLKYSDKGRKGWWRYCQLEDGYLGWIMKSSLVLGDEQFIDSWKRKPKLIVKTNYSRMLENASDNASPVSDLVFGNKIIKIDDTVGWYKARLPDGRVGFVKAEDVIEELHWLSQPPSSAGDILNTAHAFIGIPYLWGGTSVKGFDCSGFTQSVFKHNKILLPRDANMQVNSGQKVSIEDGLDNLQPGDLLFWGRRIEKITHVGIYIGDSKFIHSDGMVHVNSFDPEDEDYSEYRRRTLRAARRVLK